VREAADVEQRSESGGHQAYPELGVERDGVVLSLRRLPLRPCAPPRYTCGVLPSGMGLSAPGRGLRGRRPSRARARSEARLDVEAGQERGGESHSRPPCQ